MVDIARRGWQLFEPVHDVVYFAPGMRELTDAAGLRGFFMAYFAMRAAPLGAADADLVTATFFGFHPTRVERAIPEAWRRLTAAEALHLRMRWVDVGMRRVLGDAVVESREVREAAELAWDAAQACEVAGRPLGAANRALARPDEPHLALWQATTTLREHRGDGHIAALVSRGVSPAQSHLLKAAAGEADATVLQEGRGFPPEEWAAARDELVAIGWLDEAGALTAAGAHARADVEQATDTAARTPWRTLGEERGERLLELLSPHTAAVLAAGIVPQPSPVGLVADRAV